MAEWLRALDLKSGGPWFKSFTLPLSGFVLGSPEFNSSTALELNPGLPRTNSQLASLPPVGIFYLLIASPISTTVLNTYDT